MNDLFTAPPSQFDHQVDHVMTNAGERVRLVNSAVTGLTQVNGSTTPTTPGCSAD